MSTPGVTVLMGVYNDEAYVGEAIDSILRQTYGDFELLIVDDGSTDRTPDVLASYDDPRIRVIRNETNIGLTRSLNRGLHDARGELIARHDADDISYPERLARQVAFLNGHRDVVVLGTQFTSLDEKGRRRPLHLWMRCETSLGIRWQLMFENPFAHSSVMFRRDVVLDRYGGYDESYRTIQDFDLWSRIAREHPLRNLRERLVGLRGRAQSISAHYTADAGRRVGEILIANGVATIGDDPSLEPDIQFLVRAMNPKFFPPIDGLEAVVHLIERCYERFVDLWPEAKQVHEIRELAASLIARMAIQCAYRSPVKMSRWYLESARYHLPTFARGAVRFAAVSALALWRQNRFTEHSK